MSAPATVEELERAAAQLAPVIACTPLVLLGGDPPGPPILLKPEILQPIGSFKIRGVFHAAASLTPEAARQNNADPNTNVLLPEAKGALVLQVGRDTPAAQAGFRKFDLIQEISGKSVGTAGDAQAIVDKSKVGETLTARVLRGDKSITLTTVTGDLGDRQGGSDAGG